MIHTVHLKRREAKALGLESYNTGKPCKHGHMSDRRTSDGRCRKCSFIASKKAHQRVRDCPERWAHRQATIRAYYDANREKCLEYAKTYARKNYDKYIDSKIARASARDHEEKRQYDLLPEEDKRRVASIYREMRRLNREAGRIAYHVDHIHPLSKGGKHHPDNLQILTAEENLRKRDKLIA